MTFSHSKDKDSILKAYRDKRKELRNATDDTNDQNKPEDIASGEGDCVRPVRVSEDFPLRVTKTRTKLCPFLKSS